MTLEEEILRFINAQMVAQGKTRSEMARFMRKSPSAITKLFSRIDSAKAESGSANQKEQRALKIEDLDQMLRFLGVEFSRDILVARQKVSVKFAPIRGVVAHGIWREQEMSSDQSSEEQGAKPEEKGVIPCLPIAEFEHLPQYALQVADAHAKDYISQNGYIVCVAFIKARPTPKVDDIVVIERQVQLPAATRNVMLVERGVRKVVLGDSGLMLTPLTSDASVDAIPYSATDGQVRITDLVIGSFQLPPNISLK